MDLSSLRERIAAGCVAFALLASALVGPAPSSAALGTAGAASGGAQPCVTSAEGRRLVEHVAARDPYGGTAAPAGRQDVAADEYLSARARGFLSLVDLREKEAGGAGSGRLPPRALAVTSYEVKPGDTLYSLARRYGISALTIAQASGISVSSTLRVGQKLVILPVDGVLHTVRRGQSLWEIARSYAADERKIAGANGLRDPNSLQPGQKLIIPGAKPAPVRLASSSNGSKAAGSAQAGARVTEPEGKAAANGGVRLASLGWPARGQLTSRFGRRRGGFHTGLDIATTRGGTIRAAAAGRVVFSGWKAGYGRLVIVDHGSGLRTYYGHNSRNLVSVGRWVEKGQAIASVGSSGRSTGPHVHFEVRVGGKPVNPLAYLK